MTMAAIITLPKTTLNTSTLNAGETSSNFSVKLSPLLHVNRHMELFSNHTVDLFKIRDVNQRSKRRHRTPAFKPIFKSLAWSEVNNNFHLTEKPKFLLPTKKLAISNLSVSGPRSVFYPCSPKRDDKILDAEDFPSRENCSFIRLNDALRKTLLNAAKKNSKTTHHESRVQSNKRADFKLTYRENYRNLCGRLKASETLIKFHLLQPIQYIFGTN